MWSRADKKMQSTKNSHASFTQLTLIFDILFNHNTIVKVRK